MSLKIGIIGLPNAGKSTLFKAITKKKVLIASYPFTTINPNIGVTEVLDERLLEIQKKIKPKETVPATLEFVDIAGLIEGAHKGEGLGNQFLSHIRECDALVQVIDAFKEKNIAEDKRIIQEELLMKDVETLERMIEKIQKKEGKNSKEVFRLEKIKENLKNKESCNDLQLLSSKPVLYLYNGPENKDDYFYLDLKTEEEITELTDEERKELNLSSSLDRLIKECYNLLDLITFFTVVGGEKAQAWALKRDENIITAAEKVHTDFKERFIRGEVISYDDFLEINSLQEARSTGKIKTVGRDYIVQDGDIIEFKI